RGSLKAEDLPKRMALFTPTTDLNALKDADIVIEAVFENMPVKKELFAKIDKIAKKGAVLASNTSYLNVDEIASVTSRVPDVDGALTEFGFPMGPFAMSDLAGIDVGWRSRKERGVRAEIADSLAEQGRYGQKTGKGFYLYEGRSPRPDPEVEKLIVDVSVRLGVKRRNVSKEEIIERLIYPMVNEGARILEEGIATRPGDIDVVWLYGYGF